MNDSNISLFRALFKVGSGVLIAKGVGDESLWEGVIGGVLALWSIWWGWKHRSKPTPPGGSGVALLVAFLFLTGCSVVRVNTAHGDSVVCWLPAWPWQDSSRTIEKLTVSGRTNSATISLKGLDDSETTSTNAASLVNGVVSSAVRAAITAAK